MSNALDSVSDAEAGFAPLTSATRSRESMPERIARLIGAQPLHVLPRAPGTYLSAAWWRFDGQTVLRLHPADEFVLGFRASGTATVLCSGNAGSLRKRPGPGAVSLVDPARSTEWRIDGSCEVLHVYIPQGVLRTFSFDALGAILCADVGEFVGKRNRWLAAYFQMLAAEMELASGGPGAPASLFLAETEATLLRHLIEWRSSAGDDDGAPGERGRAVPALRKSVLRRVLEFIDANLAGEIHLGQLASVACMSEDHFLRSFRVACGTTPYRYVIEKRVEKAATLLLRTVLPIGQIARECGFKSAPQLCLRFRAVMGTQPSVYRARSRA